MKTIFKLNTLEIIIFAALMLLSGIKLDNLLEAIVKNQISVEVIFFSLTPLIAGAVLVLRKRFRGEK